jgi:SAM-dependent methyltransferase
MVSTASLEKLVRWNETGLPDNSFDFAIARLLFLHLSDPVLAAQEVLRVLKPGGKFVIIDVDDALFGVTEPEIDGLTDVIKVVAQQKAARGGDRYIGRHLPRVFKEAGYQDIDMDAIVHHSDLHGIEGFRHQIDARRFSWLLKSGLISQEQYDSLDDFSRSFGEADTYAMMLFFMGCGTRPL